MELIAMLTLILMICALATWIARANSSAVRARKKARLATQQLEDAYSSATAFQGQLANTAKSESLSYVHAVQHARLQAISVDELKRHASGLRLQALRDAGLHNLASLQGWSASRLVLLRGIGNASANRIADLVDSLTHKSKSQPITVPWPCTEPGLERPWVEAIYHLRLFETQLKEPTLRVASHRDRLGNMLRKVIAETRFWRWLTSAGNHPHIQEAIHMADAMEQELQAGGPAACSMDELANLLSQVKARKGSGVLWSVIAADMVADPNFYHSCLREHVALAPLAPPSLPPIHGFTPPTSASVETPPVAHTRATPGPSPLLQTEAVKSSILPEKTQAGNSAVVTKEELIRLLGQILLNQMKAKEQAGTPWPTSAVNMTADPAPFQGHLHEHVGMASVAPRSHPPTPVPATPPSAPVVTTPVANTGAIPRPSPLFQTEVTKPPIPPGQTIALKGTQVSYGSLDPYGIGAKLNHRSTSQYWIPAGQETVVEGYRISNGLVYIGSGLRMVQGSGAEPALINPAKVIDRNAANCHVRQTEYWPSYDNISPAARASYLQWLSTGKCDPDADIGFVFLYFYGLERRVLYEHYGPEAISQEWPWIEKELERLLSIYGQRGSFRSYASSLLDLMRAHHPNPSQGMGPSASESVRGLRLQLRYDLGCQVKEGRSLSEDWAFAWYIADPNTHLRIAAQRCPEVFRQAFCTEFRRRFPEGLKVAPNKTQLRIMHRPASNSFGGCVFTKELDVPDVTVLTTPQQKLHEVAEVATATIDAYSRHISRSVSQSATLDALLLLPPSLWPDVLRAPLEDLKATIVQSGGSLAMRLVDLQVNLPEGSDFTKARMTGLAKTLATLGLGIEPDPRFGGSLPTGSDPIVVFAMDTNESGTIPGKHFDSAALLLHLASAVAGSDGDFGDAEATLLLGHLRHGLELPESDYQRLCARLQMFRKAPPALTGLKKRVETLGASGREAIGDFLVAVAQADGVIAPGEVRCLEKIFKLLSLSETRLYSKLHTSAPAEPVSVRPAVETEVVHKIPAQSSSPSLGNVLKLDMAKVAALKADSAKVSILLGSIFADTPSTVVEELPPPETTPAELDAHPQSLLSLDAEHSGLLQVLLQRPSWSRTELEDLCADRALMVDGAIERINEAAFDRFDQPLIEGEDPIDINCDLMMEEVA